MAERNSVGLLGTAQPGEPVPQSPLPFVIAGVVVLAVLGVLLLAGRHKAPANPGGAGLAPADPYAPSLVISGVKMSESANMSGGKLTYLDGEITNKGSRTVRGITVQVAFLSAPAVLAQKETMALNLVRMTDPYVDTEPVSAEPLKPGDAHAFRLIFDHVAADWNGEYPQIRIIQVNAK